VRALDRPPVEMRCEQLRELVHVPAQQCPAAEADPGGVRGKQVRGIERDQVGSVDALDVSCTQLARPLPFFTSLNGPLP